jgi:isoleucyl-tRNA synthetase
MAIDGISAFKTVLTHGFVVDGEGRKMSKSLGNVVAPQEIIKDYGADILRLWVASSDYNDDVRISDQIVARLIEAYRKIRNTARFILGNLYDFSPEKDAVRYEDMLEIDKWALSKVHNLLKEIGAFYSSFQFHKVYHAVYSFCVTDMSNFYLDILKDRLYTFKADSAERRSCQRAIYEILKAIVASIAPILVFTAEEIWLNMPKPKGAPDSIHLNTWPDIKNLKIDNELEARWLELIKIRDLALKVLEAKRVSGIIGSSLEAKITVFAESEKDWSFLKRYEDIFPALFIVSQAELKKGKPHSSVADSDKAEGVAIIVEKADGEKCSRCWNYSVSVNKFKDYPSICQRCYNALTA